MCYDLSFFSGMFTVFDYFSNLVVEDEFTINNASTIHIVGHAYGEQPIIYFNAQTRKLHLKLMEWGCIPFYTKDEKAFLRQRASMLNARSERILGDEKSYWYKIRNRRCLIPVSGIYEHRSIPKWTKKVPYFIHLKNEPIFFLPGLYSVAELPDKETGELVKRFTFTLITRSANSLMQQIHNDGDNKWRMPLFLPLNLANNWIQPELSTEQIQSLLSYELPAQELSYWPVYTIRTPKERPDGKAKNEIYYWDNLPDLNNG